jgi:hypothetical protein
MLAKSRTPRDRARTQNLTSSMINKRGNRTNGVPSGIKWAKKSIPRLLRLRNRTQNHTKNDSPNLTAREAVTVWVNGSLPTKLRIRTSIKIAMKKGAISRPFPFSWPLTSLNSLAFILSETTNHREGITVTEREPKPNNKTADNSANLPNLESPRNNALKTSILNALASLASRNCSNGELITLRPEYPKWAYLCRVTSTQRVLGKWRPPATNTPTLPATKIVRPTSWTQRWGCRRESIIQSYKSTTVS